MRAGDPAWIAQGEPARRRAQGEARVEQALAGQVGGVDRQRDLGGAGAARASLAQATRSSSAARVRATTRASRMRIGVAPELATLGG